MLIQILALLQTQSNITIVGVAVAVLAIVATILVAIFRRSLERLDPIQWWRKRSRSRRIRQANSRTSAESAQDPELFVIGGDDADDDGWEPLQRGGHAVRSSGASTNPSASVRPTTQPATTPSPRIENKDGARRWG